jgi:glycosyltransferase involved in cell wall biosynthesis
MTPCFNHERFLDDYFAGLLAQTYENVELIIFDDGSSDGSWEKIRAHVPALERKFTRVVAERHDNIGATEELQLAIGEATGEVLCILESDDYYLPTRLEENVRFLVDHPEVGVVHSDTDWIYGRRIEHRHWQRTRGRIPTGDVYEDLLLGNFVMTCAFSCRTDLYRAHVDQEEYIRRGYMARDYAFFLDLAKHTSFGYIDKALARYRVLAGSLSRPRDRNRLFAFHVANFRMRLDYAEDPAVSPEVAERIDRDYHEYLYRQGLMLGRTAECSEGYRWLVARNPELYGRLRYRLGARLARSRTLVGIGNRLGIIPLARRARLALKDRVQHGPRRGAVGRLSDRARPRG